MVAPISSADVERWRVDLNLDPSVNAVSQFSRSCPDILQKPNLPDLDATKSLEQLSLQEFSPTLTSNPADSSSSASPILNPWTNTPIAPSSHTPFTPSAVPLSSLFFATPETPEPSPSPSDSPSSSASSSHLFALRKAAFDARDKEMQTKDGRAKWEAYETRWKCLGLWEAQKRLAIDRACAERVDFEEMLRVHEERVKAGLETGAGKKLVGKGKKGKR